MFNDGRSKRVVLVAHCFLNQNSISDGTAVYPAAFKDLVVFFLNADIGIVQMPCPELCCLGLDRGNIHGADSPVVEMCIRDSFYPSLFTRFRQVFVIYSLCLYSNASP